MGISRSFCAPDAIPLAAQDLVSKFQTRDDIPVFLLTSQVGGLGLTLTAADRVIVVDPAWNPSTDNQSVDRCDAHTEHALVLYTLYPIPAGWHALAAG